jgi:AhpD family alkylhydroperoxidase
MKEDDILNKKEKTIVLLAASIASGCQPCTKYHIERGLEYGFTEEEIGKIVVLAISVRDKATRNMESFAHNKEAESGTGIEEDLDRNDILVGIAASYSINFQTGYSTYLSIGKKRGMSNRELSEIIIISRAVTDKARSLLI